MAYAALTTIQTIAAGEVFTAATLQQANDNCEFLIDPPACSIKETTAQSVNNATATALTSNEESFDNDSMHSTTVNTSRITVQTAGRYLVSATVEFAADADGYRSVAAKVDGTTSHDLGVVHPVQSAAQTTLSGTKPIVLAAASYVEVFAYHEAGAALNVRLLDFTLVFITR